MKPGTLLWTVVLCLSVILNMQAQDHSLQLHYTFNTSTNQVPDMSANHYDAQLMNQAGIRTLDTVQVLDLGDQNGYLDMGTSVGALIAGLEDFSITTAIYIDESSNITGNGNFVWVFSTSPACGQYTGKYIAYRVNRQRYALSTGGYNNEVAAVETGAASRKGSWYQLTYTQRGSKGSLYIDSTEVRSSSSLAYTPKDIGQATEYNWIGRPHFSSDAYLKNTLISDFRIYNRALSVEEIKALSGQISGLNAAMNLELLKEAWQKLSLADTTDITSDIQLPLSAAGEVVVSWTSSHPEIISNQGKVERPAAGSDTARVVLRASLSKGSDTLYKSFEITVLPFFSPEISIQRDLEALPFSKAENTVKYKLHLPSAGAEGSSLSWISDNTAYLSHEGDLLQQPGAGEADVLLNLQVTARKEQAEDSSTFVIRIPAELKYYAYLFSYFTGNSGSQEAIRFALSFDGYNYKALNNNNPIISSEEISQMGGVRDPHILRGIDDTTFYMVVTDMKSALGWNSNHGIVMLKSNDLLNWDYSAVDIAAEFDEFSSINRAWAPQTIYDQNAGKYMLYWSMRSGSDIDVIHYAYANEEFNSLATVPKVLYHSPDATACIDGDIIYKEGKYHMFYKNEGTGNGIKKAVSDYVNRDYQQYSNQYYQQTSSAVEGSCVFKLYDSDTYILMYDVYTSGRYEFTTSSDLENFSVKSGISMDFTPRHGTVIPITRDETRRLVEQWGYGFDPIPEDTTTALSLVP
ncbi:MAG: hypothetical protein PHF61_10300, partial [Bacteroidales bacterium]|nr:hypothetical protein [Bacteroidales bacterium]